MSYNSKAFLADRERLLEPEQQLRGSQRRNFETAQAAKNRFLDSLNPAQRQQLREEAEYEERKRLYQQYEL